jgi:hypothetical protein
VTEVLHSVYLPFTKEQVSGHFAPVAAGTASADHHLGYYVRGRRQQTTGFGLPLVGAAVRGGEGTKARPADPEG